MDGMVEGTAEQEQVGGGHNWPQEHATGTVSPHSTAHQARLPVSASSLVHLLLSILIVVWSIGGSARPRCCRFIAAPPCRKDKEQS